MRDSTTVRIVLQRVSSASVTVDEEVVSSIGDGVCLFVGIGPEDSGADVDAAVAKIATLRIFADDAQKMNLSLGDVGAEVLVVSQFTLYGDVRRGRRPSFTDAGAPEIAAPLIDRMVEAFCSRGLDATQGVFGARMAVELVNDGPVTLVLEVNDGVVG